MSFAALSGTSATRCSPGAVSAGTPMVTAIPAISAECPRLLYYPRAPLSRSRARGAPSVAELPDARRLLPREPARQLAGVAPEMPVRGRGVVDGALELEVARDGVRREVERLAHALIELGPRELGRAERLDHHGHGLAHADRVGDLHLAAVGEPGGDDVLRDPARRVRARAIEIGSTRLNSSHMSISYAVFCLKKKKNFFETSCSTKRTQSRKYINQLVWTMH